MTRNATQTETETMATQTSFDLTALRSAYRTIAALNLEAAPADKLAELAAPMHRAMYDVRQAIRAAGSSERATLARALSASEEIMAPLDSLMEWHLMDLEYQDATA